MTASRNPTLGIWPMPAAGSAFAALGLPVVSGSLILTAVGLSSLSQERRPA
jgi:hypothetical protein